MRILLSILFILGFGSVQAQYNSVKEIPNPKNSGKNYVSNPDHVLSENIVRQINEKLSNLEEHDGFQMAVACVRSIGRNVPKDFATDLATHWGVGNLGKGDGVLMLIVLDQRRVEIETGYGTETVLTDIMLGQIIQEVITPYFKQENYNLGTLAGVSGIANLLSGNALEGDPEVLREINEKNAAEYERVSKIKQRNFWIAIGAWHLFGVAIYLIAFLFVRYKYDPYKKYNIIKYFSYWIWAVLFPITHIFLVFLSKRLKDRYRNQVRFSGKTNRVMHKLTEKEEDEFLTLGQQAEEIIKSVDYDVWVTDNHDDFCILSYKPIFSKYTPCPKCKYKTYYKEYDRITRQPSYTKAGQGERRYTCENKDCNHTDYKTYSIARLVKTSRTSGGAWIGTGGRGGGGFSGGGSWGGGGSFGGGSFGGGGSGGSW